MNLSLRTLLLLSLGFSMSSFAGEAETTAAQKAETAALTSEDEAAIIRQLQEKGPRDAAIDKAVAFLASKQNPDGSFGDNNKAAMTSFALMALLASGHTPESPKYGPVVKRGITYVLAQMRQDGYLGHADNSRMYGHGICTLMLTEAAGMTHDELLERRIMEAVRRAIKLILQAQSVKKDPMNQGGWRYEPNSTDSDLSLTGWQTMSLRSAKNIGIEVPGTAIQDAIGYIRRMAHPDGGFGYQNKEDHVPLRGLGMLALPVCGVYDAPELVKSTAKMLKDPPRWSGPWFYYGIYYSAVGMYQMGDQAWGRFFPILDDILLKNQKPDGSWPDPPGNNEAAYGGGVYNTAMATLALAVHYHLLPIYQR